MFFSLTRQVSFWPLTRPFVNDKDVFGLNVASKDAIVLLLLGPLEGGGEIKAALSLEDIIHLHADKGGISRRVGLNYSQ